MSVERAFELLSAAADGDLTSAERAELDKLLSESAEIRKLQGEFNDMDDLLNRLPDLNPPAGLHDQIMQQASLPRPKAEDAWSISDWFHSITLRSILGHAAATAFGALLVIVAYESRPNFGPSPDLDDLVGTMAPSAGVTAMLDRFSVDETGVSSIARLEQRGDSVVLDIRIDTKQLVEVSVDLAASGFEIEALAQTQSNFESIQLADHVLKIKGRGQRRFAVLLRKRDDTDFAGEAKISLEYSSNGILLQQGTLRLNPVTLSLLDE
ncbi:MAG: hypothetical protein OER97_07135 [Gammaproteobacteria bacterium]|nr:hypothetical protein [Gammaproteobacteria bacterium]